MHSLPFCVRVMSPERHHWKPAVLAAAVMLRTPPSTAVTGQPATRTCDKRRVILRTPPSPAGHLSAHTPRKLGFALCCHSNATRAPIANPPNSAQLGGSLNHAPKLHYIRVRAVVWAYGRGQTDRQTDVRDHNTFCVVYDSRKM